MADAPNTVEEAAISGPVGLQYFKGDDRPWR